MASVTPTTPRQWRTDLFKPRFLTLQNGNNKMCFKGLMKRGKRTPLPPRPLLALRCLVSKLRSSRIWGSQCHCLSWGQHIQTQHKGPCREGERPSARQENPAPLLPHQTLFSRIQVDPLNAGILQMHSNLSHHGMSRTFFPQQSSQSEKQTYLEEMHLENATRLYPKEERKWTNIFQQSKSQARPERGLLQLLPQAL